jgi:hypothetical protein
LESKITFSNQSGRPLHIYWVDPQNGKPTKLTKTPVKTGASQSINSHVGNEFQLRQGEEEDDEGGVSSFCDDDQENTCRRRVVNVINPGKDPIITINKDFVPLYNGEIIAEPQ